MMNRIEAVKQDVVRIAKQGFDQKMFAGTSGNLSAYLREEDLMLITPTSLRYEIMTADDVVSMKLDGTVLDSRRKPSSEWRMHAAIYELFDGVDAVVHTHSPYATAFAVVNEPIPAILIEMIPFLGGDVPCAPYAAPGSHELGRVVVDSLRTGRNGCLMSNHGVVTVGKDLEQAYIRAEYVEDAAMILHHAKQIGTPVMLS